MPPLRLTPRARAYTHLKAALATGAYRPGDAIRIITVAADLRLSTTPVREALSRLAGEQLVDDVAREGFRMAALSAADIAHLYRLESLLYAQLAASAGLSHPATPPDATAGRPDVFALLRARAGSTIVSAIAGGIGERLAPYRRQEAQVMAEVPMDTAAIEQAAAAGHWTEVRRLLPGHGRLRARYAERLRAAAVTADPPVENTRI